MALVVSFSGGNVEATTHVHFDGIRCHHVAARAIPVGRTRALKEK
jgi:hypothetical protein